MTALITGTLMSSAAAFAEELQEYTLDPMVITAQRMESKDLKTPAAVEVVTKEKLKTVVLVPLMMYCKTLWALCQVHKVLMVQQWVL